MEEPAGKPLLGWQPLTRRGVAAFAPASVGRLLVVQFMVALLAAGTMVWFLRCAWCPVISEAISRLPAQGAISAGVLDWPGEAAVRLAENHFLALVVDPAHGGAIRSPAHLQVEFGRNDVEIISLGGYVRIPYQRGWRLRFNRTGLEPWWGAWGPALLALAGALAVGGLMLTWGLAAGLYCLPAWLAGFLGNRQLSLGGSWRLAGAALMPGALLMTGAILAYGLGALDLIQLAMAGAAHLLAGWVYLIAGVLSLPGHPAALRGADNPFAPPACAKDREGRIPTRECD
jgi:hypothetical protein